MRFPGSQVVCSVAFSRQEIKVKVEEANEIKCGYSRSAQSQLVSISCSAEDVIML